MSAKRSSVWLILEKIFSLGLSLFITMFLARYLAPQQFGELNYLISLAALLAPISALGLNSIITREVVERPEKTNLIIGTCISLRFFSSLVISVIAVVVSWFYFPKEQWLGFAILLSGQIFQLLLVFDFWIQAELLNRTAAKARSFVLLFMSLVKLFGIWQGYTLIYFIIATAIEMALSCIGLAMIFQLKTNAINKLKVNKIEAEHLLKQSWWLLLSGMAAIIYLKIDQVMLGWLSSVQEVGIYAVAAKLSEVWYFFPIAIVASYFPQLISLRKNNNRAYQEQLQKLCDLLCMSAVVLALTTQLLASWGIPLLFGNEYAPSVNVLVIHIWAGVFIFMRALLSKWLISENLLKYSLLTQVLGAAMNILGNLILIPYYGAIGAAIATITGYTVASYVALFLHKDTWPMAKIMTKSLAWPIRLVLYRQRLYQ